MVMSCVHLLGQIQLPVSPSLALEELGDQGSLGMSVKADVDVCSLEAVEGIDPQNREAWRSGLRRTSQLQLTPGTGKLSAV